MSEDIKRTVEGLLPVLFGGPRRKSKPYLLFKFLADRAVKEVSSQPSFDEIRAGVDDAPEGAIRNWFNEVRDELSRLKSSADVMKLPLQCEQLGGRRDLTFVPRQLTEIFWRPSFANPTVFVINELVFGRSFKTGIVLRSIGLNDWDRASDSAFRKALDPQGQHETFLDYLGSVDETRSYLSKGEVNARDAIARWLQQKASDVKIETITSRSLQRDSPIGPLSDRHVVLLGEPRINGLIPEHMLFWKKRIPLAYELIDDGVRILNPQKQELERLNNAGFEQDAQSITLRDYPFREGERQTFVLIARLPRQYGINGATTLIGSSHNRAIRHAAEAVLDERRSQALQEILKSGEDFQIIARCRLSRGRDEDGEIEWMVSRIYNRQGHSETHILT